MFFITRFSGKIPKWQSQTVKKEFNAFLFSKFFENTNKSRDWEFGVCHEDTGIQFFTAMFERYLVPNSAWEGRSSAVPFFCHYFGFELTNAS